MVFLDFISLACFIAASLFFLKAWEKRDWSYIANGFSRAYLGAIFLLEAHFESIGIDIGDISFALLVVILADIITICIFIFGRKYIKNIEYAKATERLRNLQDKFTLMVESSPIGFFTLDTSGNFEFCNSKLKVILETENIVGKNIFDFLERETTSGILVQHKFSYPSINMITYTGKTIKVQLVGGATQNGHKTITGSIHPL